MYEIHDSWKNLFNQYPINIDEIYEIGEVYYPSQRVGI